MAILKEEVSYYNTVCNFLQGQPVVWNTRLSVRLEGIGAEDIVDGKTTQVLGLIWSIILSFGIKKPPDCPVSDFATDEEKAKKALLIWAQSTTEGYNIPTVVDFTNSWSDGLAFNSIIHRNRPDLINWNDLMAQTPVKRLENVFALAKENFSVERLLDPAEVKLVVVVVVAVTPNARAYDTMPFWVIGQAIHDLNRQAYKTSRVW
ncbi:unnamed protein product [Darwinula stevensoni]|uniref:Calponin-homology (CH) domain-containing protein n=1 Tax=Darwinula stevensoni TaxID=69355 RepID=A0A7R8X8U4_9CRUS|nr:unnamed protein product [Darwinula stevensoni]CAG0890495.1 unnamed protein product [Darwinula stevensoni]